MICDAGGRTVDLISYTITKLKPILGVEEAAPGTGSLCGSSYLNLRFEDFLLCEPGDEDGSDDEMMTEALERFGKSVSL